MTLRSLIAGSHLAAAVLLTLPILAQQDATPPAQQNPPSQSTSTQNSQKKDQPKKSAAQENPFPEAQSQAAAHESQQPDSNSEPNAPQPQNPSSPQVPGKSRTTDQNPFPEAQSEKAAHPDQTENSSQPPAGDQSYSSSRVKGLDMPTTDDAATTTTAPAANLSSLPYNPKLARKDAEIGDYYLESGNFKGAYVRFLEANHSDPGNAEAVFGLAESARHLDRRDEALRNYRLYLAALPNGPHAKEIRKALKEMGVDPAS